MQRVVQYGLGVVAVLVAALPRYALTSLWGSNFPFLTFYPAVMIAAGYGGLGPGLLATALSAAAVLYFIPPTGFLPLGTWADGVGLILFTAVNGLIAGLCELLHRSRRRAEAVRDEARTGEERLRLAQAAGRTGTFEWFPDTGEVRWTPELERLHGLQPGEFEGRYEHWMKRIHPDDRERVERTIAEAVQRRDPVETEFRVVWPDGSAHWLGSRGRMTGRRYIGIGIDLTQQKLALETQAQLAAIVASSEDAIIGKTLEGIVTSWNAGAERLFGFTAEEMIGTSVSRLMPPERAEDFTHVLAAVRRGEHVHHFETERLHKDGHRINVSLTVSPIKDEAGRIIGVSKIARDVTDRKRAEQRLRENQDRTRRLLDFTQAVMANIGEGLYTVNTEGVVSFINPVAERLLGWTSAEILGRKMHEVTHHHHPDGTPFPAEECAGLQVLRQGNVLVDHEDVFIRKDGTFFPVVYSSSQVISGGRVAGLVVVFRDVTLQKRAEAERETLLAAAQRARADAEAANRAKDDFLSVVSHELRTPLASMTNWLRVLQKDKGQLAARAIESIDRAARAQAKIVDDLLDVSRIVTGHMRLDPHPVYLSAVLRAALDTISPAAEAKGIRIARDFGASPAVVAGDPDRLQQVAWNLLSNAVKFTPAGGLVEVRVEPVDGQARITVRDTGCGISAAFLPYVFERFRQGEPAVSRRHGGLGLGLAIVRHLVELHGGTAGVQSDGDGHGTTFTVTLPLYTSRPGAGPAADGAARLDGLRVLVVDDDRAICEALRRVLEERGATVLTAASAVEARAALERIEPDVLVSDIRLPDVDGYALLEEMRAKSHRLPAVAMTAYFAEEDRGRALAAGYQAHFAKPFSTDELVAAIAELVAGSMTN